MSLNFNLQIKKTFSAQYVIVMFTVLNSSKIYCETVRTVTIATNYMVMSYVLEMQLRKVQRKRSVCELVSVNHNYCI